MFKKLLCLSLLSYICGSFANDTGAYFNLGAGAANINSLPNTTLDFNTAAGYQFNKNLTTEVAWASMPGFQWGVFDNYNVYSINEKFILPINDTFNFYGKLGLGGAFSSWSGADSSGVPEQYISAGSSWSTVGIASVGMSSKVSNNLSLYIEDNSYIPVTFGSAGQFGYTNALSIGIIYQFGSSSAVNLSQSVISEPSNPILTASTSANFSGSIIIEDNEPIKLPSSDLPPVISPPQLYFSPDCNGLNNRINTDKAGKKYLVIESKDTLWRIAKNTCISESELQRVNKFKSTKIKIGDKLYLQ